MQDFDEVEALTLRRFYDARNNDHAITLPVDEADSPARVAEIARACQSLAAKGLINWTQIFGATVGYGRITAAGIIVVDHESRAYEFEQKAKRSEAPLGLIWRRAASLFLSRTRTHFA